MNAGLALLFLVLFALVLIFGPIIYALVGDRNKALTKRQKVELMLLRQLVQEIDKVAYRDRDVAPELAYQVSALIAEYKQKELE